MIDFNYVGIGFLILQILLVTGLVWGWRINKLDYNSTLTESQKNFFAKASTEISKHADDKRYHTIWNWAFRLIWIPIWAFCLFLCWFWLIILVIYFRYLCEYQAEFGSVIDSFESDFSYALMLILVCGLAGMFFFVTLASALTILACCMSSVYPQYRILTKMYRDKATPAEVLAYRLRKLESDFKNNRINSFVPFDASKYLRKKYRQGAYNYLIVALILLPTTLFGIHSYTRTQTIFYDEAISYRKSIFGERKAIEYSDIDKVVRRCRVNTDNHLKVYIYVILNQTKIAIVDLDRWNLKRVKEIVNRLNDAGVLFVKETSFEEGIQIANEFSNDCIQALKDEFENVQMDDVLYVLDVPKT